MSKMIVYGEEARKKLQAGIDQLAHALSAATRRTLIIYLRFLPMSLLLFWAKWGILY